MSWATTKGMANMKYRYTDTNATEVFLNLTLGQIVDLRRAMLALSATTDAASAARDLTGWSKWDLSKLIEGANESLRLASDAMKYEAQHLSALVAAPQSQE
jgi:hypothetical protein